MDDRRRRRGGSGGRAAAAAGADQRAPGAGNRGGAVRIVRLVRGGNRGVGGGSAGDAYADAGDADDDGAAALDLDRRDHRRAVRAVCDGAGAQAGSGGPDLPGGVGPADRLAAVRPLRGAGSRATCRCVADPRRGAGGGRGGAGAAPGAGGVSGEGDITGGGPLALPAAQVEVLRAAYDTPPREYHDWSHVGEVLRHFRDVAAGPGWSRPAEVWLAVLYHDAIYDAGRRDNEARSARLAVAEIRRWLPDA